MQNDTTTLEDSLTVFFLTVLLYDTAVMLLGIYSNELKTRFTKTCTQKFTEASFIIAKT